MDSDPSQLPCCVSFTFITLELLWSKWAKQFSWVGQLTTPIPTFQGTANPSIKIKLDLRFLNIPCFFVEYEVRHWCFIQELNSKRGKQDRCENLAQFCKWCNSYLSMYGWICPGAFSDSETKEKTLCNSPNFSSFPIGRLPCYSLASAKRVISC